MLLSKLLTLLVTIWVSGSNCVKSATCNNTGLQYAVFSDTHWNWDPLLFKDPLVGGQGTQNLIYSSTTTQLGGNKGYCVGNFSIYGSPNVVPCQTHGIMLRGYIYAQMSGIYTVVAHEIDDAAYVWSNATALSGWNMFNGDIQAWWGRPWPSQTVTSAASNATFLYISQGQYYPIRLLHINCDGSYSAFMSIFDPLGNILMGANTPSSPSIVQYSCDGTSAPPFPYNWGQEK